ncbi:MAG: glycosyltransferase [Mycobacteriales bacterium]
MRVGLIAEQRLAPVPGGTGRYAGEVGASLVATAAPGDQVSIWTAWHRDADAARVAGASGPHRLPLPRRGLTLAWEHRRGPAPTGVDVVHATTPLLPPRRRSALVVTIHDTVPWSHPETLTPRGVSWHRRMAAVAAREADAVVVPSNAMGEQLDRLLGLGDRLRVIGLGVGADIGLPADAAARAERMRLPAGGYWLALATVEPRKGLDVLIAALA